MKNTKKLALGLLLAIFGILAASSLSVYAKAQKTNIVGISITDSMQDESREAITKILGYSTVDDVPLTLSWAFKPSWDMHETLRTRNEIGTWTLTRTVMDLYARLEKLNDQIISGIPAEVMTKDKHVQDLYAKVEKAKGRADEGSIVREEYGDRAWPAPALSGVDELENFRKNLVDWFKNLKSLAQNLRSKHNM